MSENNELKLNREELLTETAPASAESERYYMNAYLELMKKFNALQEENTDLQQQIYLLKKAVYGQKSEQKRIIYDNGTEQPSLFDEPEAEAEVTVKNAVEELEKPEKEVEVATHKRKPKRTRAEIMAALPVEEVVHECEDKSCPDCGAEMERIGKEYIHDELVYVKAKMYVRKHYVEVLKCPECGTDESKDAEQNDVPAPVFKKAAAPRLLLPHSLCSPELLAHIIFEKYVQGVPLYRQEKEFRAMGVELSRTTMANWVIYAGEKFARPVWEKMKEYLLLYYVIHADETVVQVLHEPGKKPKTDSRMWVYAAPKSSGHSNILFEYSPTRNGDNAVKFLGDYDGYLVCDGYDGYNKLTKAKRCGCHAHLRRKFVEALPLEKEALPSSKAAEGVEWCNKLFRLEQEYETRSLSADEKQKERQERSKPVLDGFYLWLETIHPVSGSKLAKAVQYAWNEKQYLYRFLEHPNIPIHNNRAENAIRPFVVSRKNFLFCDSVAGAKASAMLYSLAATATANGLDVERYFTRLFSSKDGIVLPWN